MFLGQCLKCLIIGLPGQPHPGQLQWLFCICTKICTGTFRPPSTYHIQGNELDLKETIVDDRHASASFNSIALLTVKN